MAKLESHCSIYVEATSAFPAQTSTVGVAHPEWAPEMWKAHTYVRTSTYFLHPLPASVWQNLGSKAELFGLRFLGNKMSAGSTQRPEKRLLNRRLFLCERTSFRAPKVLDAFQNIRMSEKAQSSNVCTRCAHAPTPLPTAGIRFSCIKTKCYCAQWTVQLLNYPAQIIVDRCICHCVQCTVLPSYFWLFGIRIEVG